MYSVALTIGRVTVPVNVGEAKPALPLNVAQSVDVR